MSQRRALANTADRPRRKNGQFAPYSSPTASSTARDRRHVTLPTPSPTPSARGPVPRSPSARHTPFPGSYASSPARSWEPSPLSIASLLPTGSLDLADEDLPSDLKDTLDQTQSTLCPNAPPSAENPFDFEIRDSPSDQESSPRLVPRVYRADSPVDNKSSQLPLAIPIIPTGPASPPLGKAATSAMAGQTSANAKAAAFKVLRALGQFEDDGQPMSEAEYRRSFITATLDCADEDIAQLWQLNLRYGSPAFYWYHKLVATTAGRQAADKWSTLEPKIEEQWATPKLDFAAYNRRTREEWRAHAFNIEEMLDELMDPKTNIKPHLVWANRHKALGKRVNSTDEDRVSKTIEVLPRFIINLLPKTDQYEEDFTQLMEDIGELSSSSIVDAYLTRATLEMAMQNLSVAQAYTRPTVKQPTPHPAPSTRYPASTPQQQSLSGNPRHVHFVRQTAPSDKATSLPPLQLHTPEASLQRIRQLSAPPGHRQTTREPPPHVKQERSPSPPRVRAHSREPAEGSAMSRRTVSRPPSRPLAEDTQDNREAHALLVAEWLRRNPRGTAPLSDPYPLSPGTYEQTIDLCLKCARGYHFSTACPNPEIITEQERSYRHKLLNQLKRSQPGRGRSATPAYDSYLVELDEDCSDVEPLAFDSGNE